MVPLVIENCQSHCIEETQTKYDNDRVEFLVSKDMKKVQQHDACIIAWMEAK